MKRFIAFFLVVLLIICLSVPALAASTKYDSNPGGDPDPDPHAPQTGSVAVAVLAVVACGAGGVYLITRKKSK